MGWRPILLDGFFYNLSLVLDYQASVATTVKYFDILGYEALNKFIIYYIIIIYYKIKLISSLIIETPALF